MKNHTRGFASLLLIGICAFVVLAGGTFFYINRTSNEHVLTDRAIGEIPKGTDCATLQAGQGRDYCYAYLAGQTQNPSLCEKITTKVKDDCFISVASSKKDVSFCEKVVSANKHDICYGAVANTSEDLRICDKIVNPRSAGYKELCYGNVAGKLKDPSICEKISVVWPGGELESKPADFQGERPRCYQQVASSTKNSMICSKILSAYERGKCIKGASM